MIVTRLGWPALEAAVDKRQKVIMSSETKKPENMFIFLTLKEYESK